MTDFKELGLSNKLLESISLVGYKTPTPIQEQAIPLLLAGHDLMGLAQTGTGKTAAFGLPLVQQLLAENAKPKPKSARALILAPTRELVNQIAENLRQYVKKTPLHINLVIGGASINMQRRNLERGTDILVATPGRLLDLVDRKAIYLDTANYFVLDEADQMLDLGFIHALRQIAKLLGSPRQTMLFSATMPKQVEDLSRAYLNDPVRIQVAAPGKAADKINQCVHFISSRDKANLLKDCLIERQNDHSLVFARTKHGAEKLMKHLVDCGFKANSIHGNKSQGQRDRALKAFKNGETSVLVATDVAARGIDISGISHVYNYNLPEVPENYVHRIGRTARAGAEGEAIAFCSPDEFHLLKAIEKLMGMSIRVASGEEPEMPHGKPKQKARGRGRNNSFSKRKPGSASTSPRRKKNKAKHFESDARTASSQAEKPENTTTESSKRKFQKPGQKHTGKWKKKPGKPGRKPVGNKAKGGFSNKPARNKKPSKQPISA